MKKKKRGIPEVNSSSSADIAFLLLIFFLITSSMDSDKGIARRLPPPVPKDQQDLKVEVNERNTLVVLVNLNNELMVNGEITQLKNLREKAKEFIKNTTNDPNLPELVPMEVPYFGEYNVTKNHVISLQNDRTTRYDVYIEVQNELVAAYNELRNELAKKKFGKLYGELDEDQQKAIQMIYPQKISESEPKKYGVQK